MFFCSLTLFVNFPYKNLFTIYSSWKLNHQALLENFPKMNESMWMYLTRLLPYWVIIIATCWTLVFLFISNAERAFNRMDQITDKVCIDVGCGWGWELTYTQIFLHSIIIKIQKKKIENKKGWKLEKKLCWLYYYYLLFLLLLSGKIYQKRIWKY